MYSYFFILGKNPALSVVEILNKFQPKKYSLIQKGVFKVEFDQEIDCRKVIKKLGGTIKIAMSKEQLIMNNEITSNKLQIANKLQNSNYKIQNHPLNDGQNSKVQTSIKEKDYKSRSSSFESLLGAVERYLPKTFAGKYKFGFSFYGEFEENQKKLAMDVKKELKSRGISCRWVNSKVSSLSSVVVKKNNLIDGGDDFVVVFGDNQRIYLGKTWAIQDFEGLSFRDYNRPARDSYFGMIPPKLAQMMLNIGLKGRFDQVVLDPFCGSGTMLMEAALMGVKKVFGTDLSGKAVRDSRINLRWAKDNFGLAGSKIEIDQSDVRELSKKFKKSPVDVIVTEPYLGPQRNMNEIEKAKKNLEKLYTQTLAEFGKVLKKDGRVVMVWPILRKTENQFLKIDTSGFKIVNQIPNDLSLEVTDRGTVIYGRKRQRVWREIVTLEKTGV